MKLSKYRVKAVTKALTRLGVSKGMIEWQGFGASRPVRGQTGQTGLAGERRLRGAPRGRRITLARISLGHAG